MSIVSSGLSPVFCLTSVLFSSALQPQAQPTTPRPDVTVESILDRWALAVGGVERLRKIENVYVKSSHEGTGGAGDVEEWMTRTGKRRQVSQFDIDPVVVAFDGTIGWQKREGRARKLTAEEGAGQRSAAILSTMSHLLPGHTGIRVELLGDDPSGRCHALRVAVGDGDGSVIHVDKSSALPVQSLIQFPSSMFTFKYSEWRDFDGVKLPSKLQITSEDGYEAAETVTEVRWNVALDASLFSKPSDGPKMYRFTGDGTAPSIPFETDGGHIFVQGRVQGSQPVWLLIDTAASGSLLDGEFARSVGLEPSGQGTVVGPAGPVEAAYVRTAKVTLPGVELTVSSAQTLPLEFLSRACGRRIVAILGYDFFERFVVEIDYAARTIRLREPDDFAYSGKGEAIPMTLHSFQPYVQARLDVGKGTLLEGEFVVDLGSTASLMLAQDFEAQYGILAAAGTPLREGAGGVGGEFEIQVARLGGLQLGSFAISKPVTLFPKGQVTREGAAGNIGAGVLRRFRVIVDYAHERIILEPTSKTSEPDEHDMSGLALIGDGADYELIKVRRVSADSAGARAGIQRGDIIERMNGRPASELGLSGVRELLRNHGGELDVEVRAGDTLRSVKLKLQRRI